MGATKHIAVAFRYLDSKSGGLTDLVMIATSFHRRGSAPLDVQREREEQVMESLSSGTFVGAGSFSCEVCGYVLTLGGLGRPHGVPQMRRKGVRARLDVRDRAELGVHIGTEPEATTASSPEQL